MRPVIIAIWLLLCPALALAQGVRLKDLADFEGVRGNDLVGYGLVVGLDGTGDGLRNSPFTEDMMSNILERLGVNVTGEQFRAKNVAAVIVTGQLQPFARAGSRIDVTVSAIGDASSLRGGTLVMTPLNAADGQIYAVAQGSIIAGGVVAEGEAAKTVQGVPTAGSIPSGAVVEREVAFEFGELQNLKLALKSPDFSTAYRVERAINVAAGAPIARMTDSGTVHVDLAQSRQQSPAHFLAQVENLRIEPDTLARVVVDQRSGTIVISENVRVSRVAVSKGNLTLTVQEQPIVVQPNPFAEGETLVVPRTDARIENAPSASLAEVPGGTTLTDVITGLNALGITPNDLIDILKTIKAAGALHAEFVVM
ncbi:flagellar basal body P-ring protein FlgI [Marivita geojedonensis]|uniref:Flagellar P-ring protein n=1 Tax=Marivita geojedonensis TaxID=1123756 RepID=A0A1X4NK13_9RHOB|nr:flagellar basal body P-ring protein FlgI [Marivita geojedonensis]OSQ50590.1 flagellar basal body P-ring biosynthesis protein FlgA [Marivita geojedonensis]PRY79885.1 flagellar P-ring protein precursor FlgI [Marivita geojedonensis]